MLIAIRRVRVIPKWPFIWNSDYIQSLIKNNAQQPRPALTSVARNRPALVLFKTYPLKRDDHGSGKPFYDLQKASLERDLLGPNLRIDASPGLRGIKTCQFH